MRRFRSSMRKELCALWVQALHRMRAGNSGNTKVRLRWPGAEGANDAELLARTEMCC